MIDFWMKTENEQVEMIPGSGIFANQPNWKDSWDWNCFSAHQKDDGSWVVRLYLNYASWVISLPSYAEHLADTGAATSIAASSPNDWTAEEVNQSFSCSYTSTHYEPADV